MLFLDDIKLNSFSTACSMISDNSKCTSASYLSKCDWCGITNKCAIKNTCRMLFHFRFIFPFACHFPLISQIKACDGIGAAKDQCVKSSCSWCGLNCTSGNCPGLWHPFKFPIDSLFLYNQNALQSLIKPIVKEASTIASGVETWTRTLELSARRVEHALVGNIIWDNDLLIFALQVALLSIRPIALSLPRIVHIAILLAVAWLKLAQNALIPRHLRNAKVLH